MGVSNYAKELIHKHFTKINDYFDSMLNVL
jgi:hypothetical protein